LSRFSFFVKTLHGAAGARRVEEMVSLAVMVPQAKTVCQNELGGEEL
jgi:hypothetical protein